MKYKLERFIKWLKQAWAGCFNVWIHVGYALDSRMKEKLQPESFERALRGLSLSLLRSGVVKYQTAYDICNDWQQYRLEINAAFKDLSEKK